jgi:hypothetical protein
MGRQEGHQTELHGIVAGAYAGIDVLVAEAAATQLPEYAVGFFLSTLGYRSHETRFKRASDARTRTAAAHSE